MYVFLPKSSGMQISSQPYIVMCGLSECTIFFYIFGKKVLDIKCVFRFSLQLLSETFIVL